MDPIERIDIDADSTFVLMLESQKRGHELLYAHPSALIQRGDEVFVKAQVATVQRQKGDHFKLSAPKEFALNDVDAVFMRRDPPYDMNYMIATLLLDRVDERVLMINNPAALRDFNEKLCALRWPQLMPRSMVAADRAALRDFIHEVERAVVKPLIGAGGYGIVQLRKDDPNIGSVLDLLTEEGRVHIEAQAYLEAVEEGDKRIVLLDGVPIGAINRRPQKGDIRANMHVGGSAEPSELSERDQEICAQLGPVLSESGLVFVGIDVIGGLLTEINVTSPTGLQEINRFNNVCLEAQIIAWVEARLSAR